MTPSPAWRRFPPLRKSDGARFGCAVLNDVWRWRASANVELLPPYLLQRSVSQRRVYPDSLNVLADCAGARTENLGNLAVSLALAYPKKHFGFAFGEAERS